MARKAMTKEQLLEYAAENGIEVDPALDRDQLSVIICAGQPASDQGVAEEGGDPVVTEDEGAGGGEPPAETTVSTGNDCEIGTIRVVRGVESVYIGEGKWVPTIRENIETGKPVKIISKKRAGQTIFAKTGRAITFDSEGKALVSAVDGQYLESIVTEDGPEYTVE